MLRSWFEQFLKEKTFLRNATAKTLRFYRQSFKKFCWAIPVCEKLDRAILNEFVIKMRESGLSPISRNVYIRGMNSFLSWLYENQYSAEHLKIRQLKEEQKIIQCFSEQQLKAILSFKPKGFYEWRIYTIPCLLIDTRVRIEEALTLTRPKLD